MQFRAFLSPFLLLATVFIGHSASADVAVHCSLSIVSTDGVALKTPEIISQGSLGLIMNSRISFEALREPNTLKRQTLQLELHQASVVEVSLYRKGFQTLSDTINLQTPKSVYIEAREHTNGPMITLLLQCQ